MNWDILQRELATATAFQMEQVRSVIGQLINDPARIARIRDRLRPGMIVRYWDHSARAEIECEITELRRTVAVVKHTGDGQIWRIDITLINVDSETPLAKPPLATAGPRAWKIGDTVCFPDRENREIVGQIVKLNPKRAKVRTDTGIWTVSYPLLSEIVDAEATVTPAGRFLLESDAEAVAD